jgi:hypothetical protein
MSVRFVVSLSLCWVLFLSPISLKGRSGTLFGPTPNEPERTGRLENSPDEDVDSFIIENVDGLSTCREATREEVSLTLPRPDDRGVPVENLLAHRKSSEDISTGLTINFVALSQLQTDPNMATVVAAFQRAAAVWTARIKSPVTISINIDYGLNSPSGGAFGSNVLGSTSSRRATVDYQGAKTNLLAGSSSAAETALYNLLPNFFVPTDNGNGAVVSTNRSVAFALGIPVPGSSSDQNVATMGFNKNFPFDFNPDDGISGGTDFVAVATHEIGHALGFVSSAGGSLTSLVTTWDLFRFRPGTTTATFPTATRIMSIGGGSQVYFTGETFVVNGVPTTELGLSTGGPSGVMTNGGDGKQSSHWKADEQTGGQYIGIMDPTIAANVHEVTTENDFATLETIGWNLVSSVAPPPAPPLPSPPSNDNFANAQIIGGSTGSTTGLNVGATRETGEPIHSPDNVVSNRSVWYQWQAPASSCVTITTAGSAFDTVLGVYTGSSVGALVPIAKNDDVASGNQSSSVTFNVTAGTIYRIAVDGYNNSESGGDFGTFVLNWGGGVCVVPQVQFTSNEVQTNESNASVAVAVMRTGNASGSSTVDYATSSGQFHPNCANIDGSALSRCDYIETIGTLTFAPGETSKDITVLMVDDSYHETQESFSLRLSNATGATLGINTTAFVRIADNDASNGPNPIDSASFFVRQHYLDFLNREPDSAGFNFWTTQINSCGADAQCIELKRINVSGAFFLSIEFQETGYLVYRVRKSAFGNFIIPTASPPEQPVPIVLSEFLRDTQKIGQGVQVNVGNWEQQLEANKQEYMLAFVQRPDFVSAYPSGMSPSDFVTQLSNKAGAGVLSPVEQANLISIFGGTTSDVNKRAQVLRAVAEDTDLRNAEFNKAFVVMQYFGYLRRNPDEFPDETFAGLNFWLNKLNSFNGNFVTADMVKSFLVSGEYRQRFGP